MIAPDHVRPLTLLWRRTTLDRVPESFFIERVLLGMVERPIRVVAIERIAEAPFVDDVLIVSLSTEFAPYLIEARRRGHHRLTLLHLGDEHGNHARDWYGSADLVFRNYWFADATASAHVHWIPNGYALGVGPAGRLLPASRRTVSGFFAGALGMRTLSDERRAMKTVIEQAGLPFTLRWTATARDRLGPAAYAAALGDARFALVPGGNSPETIRLYDALEMGAIPIMLRSAFTAASDALNGPPLMLLDDWRDLPDAYARAIAGDVDGWQTAIVAWWQGFKAHCSRSVAARIAALSAW